MAVTNFLGRYKLLKLVIGHHFQKFLILLDCFIVAITTTTTTVSKKRDGNFCSIVGWSRKSLDV